MFRLNRSYRAVGLMVLFAALGLAGTTQEEKAKHDVYIDAPAMLAPQSTAGARVIVFESTGMFSFAPVEGAEVGIALVDKDGKRREVFEGETGKEGSLDATFPVPDVEEGDYTMEIKTSSGNGTHVAKRPVKVRREHKILLVSDKPLYQPGQEIHMRALALDGASLRAASGELVFEVEDAKGNKVFKRKEMLSRQGVASADFQLADEVNMGAYRVRALLGRSSAEKVVTVKKYVLPKFKVGVKTDKTWYMPKERVKGTLQVDYFFGKPVAGGDVKIVASTFDVEFKEFATVRTKTDKGGAAEFEVDLPDYFVGQPLEKGNAFVKLDVSVVDTAEHVEEVAKTFNVASRAIDVGVIPESGKVIPGLENVVYVVATSPDGGAVECEVELEAGGKKVSGTTNDSGFVAMRIKPEKKDLTAAAGHGGDPVLKVQVKARDKKGNEAQKEVSLSSEVGHDQMLLRLDRAVYRAGETAVLEMYGTFEKSRVFVDAVREGQTVLTATCGMEQGKARYRLDLPESLFGSLEVHAYKILGTGEIVRDTRVIYVHPPQDLQIGVKTSEESYKPGERAVIDFRVTDREGRGVSAALGVIVVDESVYALQDMQPGLEKAYFTLAKELREPRYQIKLGGSMAGMVQEGELAERKQEMAKILLAPVIVGPKTWQANTMSERMAQYEAKLEQIYWGFYYYIVSEKKEFSQPNPKTKKREFRDDLLRVLLDKRRQYKLPKEALVDPWGNRVMLPHLEKLSRVFSFEYWAKLMSAGNVQQIFGALYGWVTEHDVLEGEGFRAEALKEMVQGGVLKAEVLTDYFGERLTLKRLSEEHAAFRRENIEKMTADQRKQAIFEALRAHVNRAGGLTHEEKGDKWGYEEGLLGKLGVVTRKPGGGAYTLAELADGNGAFAASNLAKIVSVERRKAVYDAVLTKVRKDGWNKVAVFEKEWKYVDGLLTTLIRDGFLTLEQATDIGGKRVDIGEVMQKDAQFRPVTLLSSIIRTNVQKIDNAICRTFHQGRNTLPEKAIAQLVEKKVLKAEEVEDPWGTELRFDDLKRGERSYLGCGLLGGKKTLVSAGPDRKFGTEDDIRYRSVAGADGFRPNYAGCVFYQRDQGILGFAADPDGIYHGMDDEEGEMQGFGALRSGEKNQDRLRRFRGGGGGPPRTNAPMKEDSKKAKAEPGDAAPEEPGPGADDGGMPAIRVREYFPETLAWKPLLITDGEGRASLALDMADSITTWRLTASANTAEGMLGSTTHGILVFQPFFVDIDFPVTLTQNDAVSVPVAVYNYLKEDQTITLKVEKEDWFELKDEETKKLKLKAGEVRAVYFRVKVKGLGPRKLTVWAWGKDQEARDAVRRQVEVVPDGKMMEVVLNDRLGKGVQKELEIPANAIPGSFKIFCKCYPGVFSQLVEGVQGMLGMPHG